MNTKMRAPTLKLPGCFYGMIHTLNSVRTRKGSNHKAWHIEIAMVEASSLRKDSRLLKLWLRQMSVSLMIAPFANPDAQPAHNAFAHGVSLTGSRMQINKSDTAGNHQHLTCGKFNCRVGRSQNFNNFKQT
jgi:hypothetical protein